MGAIVVKFPSGAQGKIVVSGNTRFLDFYQHVQACHYEIEVSINRKEYCVFDLTGEERLEEWFDGGTAGVDIENRDLLLGPKVFLCLNRPEARVQQSFSIKTYAPRQDSLQNLLARQ